MNHANCLGRVGSGQDRKVIEDKFTIYAPSALLSFSSFVAFTEYLFPERLGHDPGHKFLSLIESFYAMHTPHRSNALIFEHEHQRRRYCAYNYNKYNI
ncbi:hypothetical protein [Methanosarcina barkeri]|uniref:hypothetical protein n=1 Tax=Methanosarcina barkeri TaxID=2208 RepID=UPI001E616C9C|nr:hypothetical protein [Methanosarcina barkeri]